MYYHKQGSLTLYITVNNVLMWSLRSFPDTHCYVVVAGLLICSGPVGRWSCHKEYQVRAHSCLHLISFLCLQRSVITRAYCWITEMISEAALSDTFWLTRGTSCHTRALCAVFFVHPPLQPLCLFALFFSSLPSNYKRRKGNNFLRVPQNLLSVTEGLGSWK